MTHLQYLIKHICKQLKSKENKNYIYRLKKKVLFMGQEGGVNCHCHKLNL